MSLTLLAFAACGKPTEDNAATLKTAGGTVGSATGQSALKGYAAFGSQCNSGFSTDPKAVRLDLGDCALGTALVELAEPIQPLNFQADCVRKTLTIRSYDRSIDDTWELMPDGFFEIVQERLGAKFKDDGTGHGACATPISMYLRGKVDCSTTVRDQAKIHFETYMWLNKGPAPASIGSSPRCGFPAAKCFMHAITTVNQCT